MRKPKKPKEPKDKETNRLRRRLYIKYSLICTAVLGSGVLAVLLFLAICKNYYQSDDDLITMFTNNIYTVIILFLSILILVLIFKAFIYEVAYRDAEDDWKDEEITITEIHEGEGKVLTQSTTTATVSLSKEEKKEEEKTTNESRFPTLTTIDRANPTLKRVTCSSDLTLESFSSHFREYCSGELHLYYSMKTIRSFIASMCSSRIILLQGMSGTGKTSLPVAFGKFISNTTSVVPVQPTWKERSDLLGYYNEFTGKFSETPLLTSLYEAGTSDSVKLIVLDEANIARVEYYFAEFLSLLELPDQNARILQVASSGMEHDPKRMANGAILLPENVWFIGTANNDDSTFAISDKVYDRASVLDLDSRAEPFRADSYRMENLSIQRLNRLSAEAQRRYALTERDMRKIARLDTYLRDTFHVSFGNRIMRQIQSFVPVFVACGGSSYDALDVILSKKVLRKLAACNPVLVKARSQELIDLIVSLFGEKNCTECVAAVRKIAENG